MANERAVPGQPFRPSARVQNELLALLDAWRSGELASGGGAGMGGAGMGGIVPVRNDSGGDLDRFAVLGINGVIYTPNQNLDGFKNGPALAGVTPNYPDAGMGGHRNKFVVLQEPLASSGIGRAMILGVTPVKVNVLNLYQQAVDVENGNATRLRSCWMGGGRILCRPDALGEQWAFVAVGFPAEPMQGFWAKVTSVQSEYLYWHYKYTFVEVEKGILRAFDDAGEDTHWVPVTGGRCGVLRLGPENGIPENDDFVSKLHVGSVTWVRPVWTANTGDPQYDLEYWASSISYG